MTEEELQASMDAMHRARAECWERIERGERRLLLWCVAACVMFVVSAVLAVMA